MSGRVDKNHFCVGGFGREVSLAILNVPLHEGHPAISSSRIRMKDILLGGQGKLLFAEAYTELLFEFGLLSL